MDNFLQGSSSKFSQFRSPEKIQEKIANIPTSFNYSITEGGEFNFTVTFHNKIIKWLAGNRKRLEMTRKW